MTIKNKYLEIKRKTYKIALYNMRGGVNIYIYVFGMINMPALYRRKPSSKDDKPQMSRLLQLLDYTSVG